MWAIRAIASITSGKAWGPFTICGEPRDAIIIATEDGWQDTVRPRLELAEADLGRVYVFSDRDDGEGAPTFPADMARLRAYDIKPSLVVVDSWIDTVSGGVAVKDTQQAREALRPWREYAADTHAAVLLVTHTNRMTSSNARDTYGLSAALRQTVRSSLYAIRDGDELIVGTEKSNAGRTDRPAERYTIAAVQHFAPARDSDGTVGRLDYVGPSNRSIRHHIADAVEPAGEKASRSPRIDDWLTSRLANGAVPSADLTREGKALEYSQDQIDRARKRIGATTPKRGDLWFTELRR